ncbi:unnamed protein product [Merluccius merluccius]
MDGDKRVSAGAVEMRDTSRSGYSASPDYHHSNVVVQMGTRRRRRRKEERFVRLQPAAPQSVWDNPPIRLCAYGCADFNFHQ